MVSLGGSFVPMQESQKNIVDGMEKAFHIVGVIQPTIHMTTTEQTNDLLIRALYSAKADMKDACTVWQTAEHNLADSKNDRHTTTEALERITAEEAAAYAAYVKVEKIYDTVRHACSRLNLL